MAVSYVALLPLAFLALLLFGGLAVVIALLVNPKTRVIGIVLVLLGLVMGGLAVVVLMLFLARATAVSSHPPREAVMEGEFDRGTMRVRIDESSHGEIRFAPQPVIHISGTREQPSPLPSDGGTRSSSHPTKTSQPAASPKSKGVFKAVGTAISKAATGPRPEVERVAAKPKPVELDRPAWVNQSPGEVNGVYRMSITVGPYTTRRECDARLPEAVNEAAVEYVDTYLREKAGGRVPLDLRALRQQSVKDRWEETIQASVGPMVQLHVLLEFDHQFNQRVEEEWRRAVVHQRLWYAGRGVAAVLVMLATSFAWLKVEGAMEPVGRRRLRVAGVVAILVLVAALALFIA